MSGNAKEQAPVYYQHFRNTSVGYALVESLNNMINSGQIEPQAALQVLNHFDSTMPEELANTKSQMSLKGGLDYYRYCDDVWTFSLKAPNIKLDDGTFITPKKLKVFSMNGKKPGET